MRNNYLSYIRHFFQYSLVVMLFGVTFISYSQTTIYIDPSYTGTTQNGSIQNPYKSWNSVSWVNGNTYLQKSGTTFNTTGGLNISSRNNITIGSYGSGTKPRIISSGDATVKAINITSCYNMRISGIEVASTTGQIVSAVLISGTGSANNLIENCVLRDAQWGVRILTTSPGNRIINCEIYNTQDDGIYIKDTPDIEIAYCNIYNVNLKYFVNPDQNYSPGDNIQIASTNSHYFNIHHNTLDHSSTGNKFCFIAWGNNYSGVIEYNTIIGNVAQNVSCIYLSPTTGNVIVRYNEISGGNYGIYAYVSNFQVYYNSFISNKIGICVLNNYHMLAENNVFYNNTNTAISALSGSNVTSKNNIFFISGSGKSYSTNGTLVSNNNVFNVQSSGFINGHSTLSAWRSASGQDMNSIVGNPQFVNPAARNFAIQPNSPCINAGVTCGYQQDFFGNQVPFGTSADIGYHEFVPQVTYLPPVIANQTFSVAENSAAGTVVGQVNASDPNSGATMSFSITAGNVGNTFAINPATGVITILNNQLLNFESNPQFSITVAVVNEANLTSSATMTINLTDLNEQPIIPDQGFNINENSATGTFIGQIQANDPDNGQQLNFSIVGGNDNNTFALSPTGTLTVNNKELLDFETRQSFNLTVKVQDNGQPAMYSTANIAITVLDVNENPVVSNQNFTVTSSSQNGTIVGTVIASDPDHNQVLQYVFTTGNQNNVFNININTGIISVANSSLLSSASQYILTVKVTDNGNPQLFSTCSVTINVIQINLAPVINAQTFSINENSETGTVVGQVQATDPNVGQVLTYALISGNMYGTFSINSSGLIVVANNFALDYELIRTFNLTIRVTDNGSPQLSSQAIITVNVNNINEAPVITPNQSFDVLSTAPHGYVIGTVQAQDPENNTLLFEIIGGNLYNTFAIQSSTGQIIVADANQLKRLANKTIVLNIRASDNGTPSLSSIETVQIRVIKRKSLGTMTNELVSSEVVVYPNPSIDGIFSIKFNRPEPVMINIEVLDPTGNLIFTSQTSTENTYQLNLSEFSKGSYFVRISTLKDSEIKKLIIQ